jgi:hypothetical protein
MAASPTDPELIRRDFAKAFHLMHDKREEYGRRERYYKGTNTEVVATKQLELLLERYGNGQHFGLTYAAVPVDALIDRCDLTALTVENDDASTKKLKEAFWDENDLDDDADDYHVKAAYLGDYYALVWPDDDEAEDATRTIDVLGKHPLNAIVLYDEEAEREPVTFVFMWKVGKDTWRANQVYDDLVVEWIAVDSPKRPEKAEAFERVADEESDDGTRTVVNEWGWPVMHFRPDSKPYGTPVNIRGYGPQDAITKLNASDMATIDYMVLPQRYALLDPDAEADDDIAEDFNDHELLDGPAQDFDPSRMIQRAGGKLKSLPGSTWLLRGVKTVGEFAAMTGTPFQDREEFQIRSMAVLTRTPLYEFNPADSGTAPSGEARRRADGTITKHAKKVMSSFGSEWSKGGEVALKMLNIAEGKKVEPVWMPPEVATDKEGMELVGLKTANGVPVTQALAEAGYTDEQIKEWFPTGDEVHLTIDMLKSIGPAMQALGQAVTLGSASDEDIRLMVPWLLVGAAPEAAPPLNDVKLGIGLDGQPIAAPVVPGAPTPPGVPPAPPKGLTPPQLAPTALPPAPGKVPAPVG